MKFFSIQKSFQFLTGVPFAIFVLLVLALASSIGSVIEQEETLSFYQQNYPIFRPIFGILTWKVIVQFGLDHVYRTGWFFALLGFLVVSLISCTLTRQLPIFSNSKESFFRKKKFFRPVTFFDSNSDFVLFQRNHSNPTSRESFLCVSKRELCLWL